MNATKIRKNFVFDEETVEKLEKLKNVNHKSATKVVQDLIAQSYQFIARQERKKAFDEYLRLSRESTEALSKKFGDKYKNMTIQSLKLEMAEESLRRCL